MSAKPLRRPSTSDAPNDGLARRSYRASQQALGPTRDSKPWVRRGTASLGSDTGQQALGPTRARASLHSDQLASTRMSCERIWAPSQCTLVCAEGASRLQRKQ
eukprot:1885412-Pleurochrysis_carterae.AAC.1